MYVAKATTCSLHGMLSVLHNNVICWNVNKRLKLNKVNAYGTSSLAVPFIADAILLRELGNTSVS